MRAKAKLNCDKMNIEWREREKLFYIALIAICYKMKLLTKTPVKSFYVHNEESVYEKEENYIYIAHSRHFRDAV